MIEHWQIAAVVALLVVFIVLRSLRKLHQDRNVDFDLRDLLMENGRVSKAAAVMMGSFAATTWFFIYYALNGKMTEGYFGLYIGAWIAPVVARLVSNGATNGGSVKVTTETTVTPPKVKK